MTEARDYGRQPRTLAELADWQGRLDEAVIEPERKIIDPHHHLWIRGAQRYLSDDFAADIATGHDICASVFVEAETMYKPAGPPALRSLGETEFASGVGAMALAGAFGGRQICAGIVGRVELGLGEAVREILDAHVAAGGGRFRGVRNHANYAPAVTIGSRQAPQGVLSDPAFRQGFACLAPLGLSYDSWQFFDQLPELTSLARAFPATPIVLNHVGAILGVGPYRHDDYFERWRAMMADLATCPNVTVKLGGLGMAICGFDHFDRPEPASSAQLAADWRPFIRAGIDLFGPARCMFESNFPADKQCGSYHVLWNAFKRLAENYSANEKADLFYGTAARVYRLDGLPGADT